MKINYIQTLIKEYDISSANISILAEANVISDEMYDTLRSTYKIARNKTIGKLMITHPEIKDIIYNGIKKYMLEFIKSNKIKRSNILEIATDAIFVMNPPEADLETMFDDHIIFKDKGTYFSMLEFDAGDGLKSKIKIYGMASDVKVRGGKVDTEHAAYKLLCQMINCKRNGKPKDMYSILKKFTKIMNNKEEKQLINTCSNEWLLNVITEFCNVII